MMKMQKLLVLLVLSTFQVMELKGLEKVTSDKLAIYSEDLDKASQRAACEDHIKCKEGICQTQRGVHTCICNDGFEGLTCDLFDCDRNSVCLTEKKCESVSSEKCRCSEAWAGTDCQKRMTDDGDEAEVTEDPVERCDNGFTGRDCNIAMCPSHAHCESGECEIKRNQYFCKCHPGYIGATCNTATCTDYDGCNEGDCSVLSNFHVCTCHDGYTGEKCDQVNCKSNSDCPKERVCQLSSVDGVCTCPKGYVGEFCNENICSQDKTCYNGGKCKIVNDEDTCVCPPQTAGSSCEFICEKDCGIYKCVLTGETETKCSTSLSSKGVVVVFVPIMIVIIVLIIVIITVTTVMMKKKGKLSRR